MCIRDRSLLGGGTTTVGGGTAISGGGTPDTGGGTPFRLNLTTGYSYTKSTELWLTRLSTQCAL